MSIRSISGSATRLRQSPVDLEKPSSRAARAAISGDWSATVCSSTSNGRSKTRCAVAKPNTCVLPMKPVPMRPMRSFGFSAAIEIGSVHDQGRVDALAKEVQHVLHGRDGHALTALGGQRGVV